MSTQYVKAAEFNAWKNKIEDRIDSMKSVTKPKTKRQPTEYQMFVKKQLVLIKRKNPGISQPEAFKMAAQMWASKKQ